MTVFTTMRYPRTGTFLTVTAGCDADRTTMGAADIAAWNAHGWCVMSEPTPPGYASDPTLELLWGPPPAYTGDTGPQGASGSGGAPLTAGSIEVNLATVQAAEQAMLSAVSTIINTYNPLEQQVQADISGGTVFGQHATYTASYDGTPETGFINLADQPLQQGAAQFAAQMNPAMTRALRAIADAAASVGVFIALLDKAGQAYTAADLQSAFPVPPPGGE
jgi:hypothetical protein